MNRTIFIFSFRALFAFSTVLLIMVASALPATDGTYIGTTTGDVSIPTNWSSNPTIPDGIATFNTGPNASLVCNHTGFAPKEILYTTDTLNQVVITFGGTSGGINFPTGGSGLINNAADDLIKMNSLNLSGTQNLTFPDSTNFSTGSPGSVQYSMSGASTITFLGDTNSAGRGLILCNGSGSITLENSAKDVYLAAIIDPIGTSTSSINLGANNLHLNYDGSYSRVLGTSLITPGMLITGTGSLNFAGLHGAGIIQSDNSVTGYTGGTNIRLDRLYLGGAGALYAYGDLSLTYYAAFDISSVTSLSAIGTLTGEDTTNISLGSRSLITNTTVTSTFAGQISDGLAGGSLVVQGSGNLILSRTNSYVGGTTITDATLSLADSGTLYSSGTIRLTGTGTFDITNSTNPTTSIGNLSGSLSTHVNIGENSLIINSSGTSTYSGAITGTTGSLTVDGSGTLILTGSTHTYTGGTTISSANLSLAGSGAMPATGTISLTNTGTLDISGITAASTTVGGLFSSSSASTLNIGAKNIITNTNATSTFASLITGTTGSLTQQGPGNLILTNPGNTYAGGTFISAGTLSLSGSGALVSTGTVTLSGTATFDITNSTNPSTAIGPLSGTSTNTVAIGTNALVINTAGTSTYGGTITGTTGSLTVQGAGVLVLTGFNDTFTGGTTLSAGTLSLVDAGALPATGTITLIGTGTLDVSGIVTASTTIGEISSLSTSSTLNIGTKELISNTNSTSTFASAITGTTGSLVQQGTGNLILTNAGNTYTGGTVISAGTLSVADSGALAPTGAVTLSGTGTFDITNSTNPTTTIGNLSGNSTNTVAIGANALITNTAGISTYAGSITGTTGSLTVEGSGVLVLSGANNTYTGGTTISAGTLSLSGAGELPLTGTITLSGTGTLDISEITAASTTIGALSSSSSSSFLNLGAKNLISNTDGTSTFASAITGIDGSLTQQGTGNLILTNPNNTYTGPTTITNGTLSLVDAGVLVSTSSVMLSGIGIFDITQSTNLSTAIGPLSGATTNTVAIGTQDLIINTAHVTTYAGAITGTTGNLTVQGTGVLVLTGSSSTYTGGTTISSGTLSLVGNGALPSTGTITLVGTGTLDVSQIAASSTNIGGISALSTTSTLNIGAKTIICDTPGITTFASAITGTAGSLRQQGTGTLILTGNSTYTGGTFITAGTVELANAGSLAPTGSVTLGGIGIFDISAIDSSTEIGPLISADTGTIVALGSNSLVINESASTVYAGSFTGTSSSSLTVTNSGLLNLTGNSSTFPGTTVVSGHLAVNGKLGNTVSSPTIVAAGGTLSGTGYLGAVTVNQNGVISPGNSIGTINVVTYTNNGGNYLLEINDQSQSDLIKASGAVVLNGGVVLVSPANGQYNLSQHYTIITGTSVTGTFASSTILGGLHLLRPVLSYDPRHVYLNFHTNLQSVAQTCQLITVASQLDSILAPTPQQVAVLNQLINLPGNDIQSALKSMSGVQHSDDALIAWISNRAFIRRLYDPLRPIVTKNSDKPSCLRIFRDLTPLKDITFWMEFGGSKGHINGSKDAYSVNTEAFEATLGVQKELPYNLTVGIAGSHEYERVRYKNSGTGTNKSGLIGLYGLYRPDFWYSLVDFAYGNSTGALNRTISLGSVNYKTNSHPYVNQFTFYTELGHDLESTFALTQLFAGIEVATYRRSQVTEHSTSGLQLSIAPRNNTNVLSRFGVHISTYRLPYNTFVSVDLAWLKKLSNSNNSLTAKFVNFGNAFTIDGTKLNNNSLEGALTLSSRIFRDLKVFAEASGEVGSHFCSYNLQGGLEFLW